MRVREALSRSKTMIMKDDYLTFMRMLIVAMLICLKNPLYLSKRKRGKSLIMLGRINDDLMNRCERIRI
jgi:hypothetical protein